jgi:hypothetical protein
VDKPQAGIVKFVHNEDSYIDHARALNAVGYLVRQTSARLLAGAIREVHRKTAFFTSQAPLSRLNPRTVAAAGAEHSLAFSAVCLGLLRRRLRWLVPRRGICGGWPRVLRAFQPARVPERPRRQTRMSAPLSESDAGTPARHSFMDLDHIKGTEGMIGLPTSGGGEDGFEVLGHDGVNRLWVSGGAGLSAGLR